MPRPNKKFTLGSIIFLVHVLISGASWAQKSGKLAPLDLNRKIGDYNDEGADVFQLLSRAADKLQTPLGVEINGHLPSQPASIHISNGTLGDIFSAILQNAPDYKWVDADGVIDVLPRENADSVLDLNISHFEIRNAPPEDIRAAIVALPEVQVWLTQNRVTERSFLPPIISPRTKGESGGPRVSIDLSGLTLRQIMNRIISKKNSSLHVWSLTRYGASNEYLSIGIS